MLSDFEGCAGTENSPINIADNKIELASDLPALTGSYTDCVGCDLKNTGHGLQMDYTSADTYNLNIGGILGKHYSSQCNWGYFGNGMNSDSHSRRLTADGRSLGGEAVAADGTMDAHCYIKPDEWYKLPGGEACEDTSTAEQSPIDITNVAVVDDDANLPTLTSEYATCVGCKVRNTGHTLQLDYDVESKLDIGKILSKHYPGQCSWGYFGKGMMSDTRRRLGAVDQSSNRNLASAGGMDGNCYVKPDEWYKMPGNYKCKDKSTAKQSPINIIDNADLVTTPTLPELVATYDKCEGCTVTNDGHTIQLDYNGDSSLEIGSILGTNFADPLNVPPSPNTEYHLKHTQLHWGDDSTKGSEHQVEGKTFPLELHMVHTQHGNDSPTNTAGGLAIIAVMFEITTDAALENTEIKKLADTTHTHVYTGAPYVLGEYIDVNKFLPDDMEGNYVTYEGSLTSPGCYESVNWIVSTKTLKITEASMEKFREAQWIESTNQIISHNNRPVQPLNGRSVYQKGASFTTNLAAAASTPSPATITSADIEWPEGISPKSEYSLLETHLHWGEESTRGSEHQVNGQNYPLELQLVHTQDGNKDAKSSPGGLTIIAVMFEITADAGEENSEIKILADAAAEILPPDSYHTLASNINIDQLLPTGFADNYLTYKGSLTTPGCYESVNWIVSTKTLKITEASMVKLRALKWQYGQDAATTTQNAAYQKILRNNRPVQDLNGRSVYQKGASLTALSAAASTADAGATPSTSADINWSKVYTKYSLLEAHFHWGETDSHGSEHQINGKTFPIELQLVHTQNNNPDPTHVGGGLAMIGVMFQLGAANAEIAKMLAHIDDVKGEDGNVATIAGDVNIAGLLPTSYTTNYYTYKGSLTTPGCFETVNWIVAQETMTISQDQLDTLKSVVTTDGVPKNYRPVQYIGSRKVYERSTTTGLTPVVTLTGDAHIDTTTKASEYTGTEFACNISKTSMPTYAPTPAPDLSEPVEWYQSPGAVVIIVLVAGLAVFALVWDSMSTSKGSGAKQVQPIAEGDTAAETPVEVAVAEQPAAE
jgi:carbonic anhydrase